MVFEFLLSLNLILNSFFAAHIIFISHMYAAVFLILTETTINMRIVTPMLDGMESMIIGNIPLLPNLITAVLFIVWATFSIYLYQIVFQFVLRRYESQIALAVFVIFILFTVAINIKYRD